MKLSYLSNAKLTNVQAVALKQIMVKVSKLRELKVPKLPKNGWVRTLRELLGMSGAQLGERIKLTRNQVSILERKEAEGTITLNQLKILADGLDADLVYAVVPRQSIEDTIDARADKIAEARLKMSNQNMFLEAQQLSLEQQKEAKEMLKTGIKAAGGKVLWKKDILE